MYNGAHGSECEREFIHLCMCAAASRKNKEANAKQNHDSNKINKVMEQIFVKK